MMKIAPERASDRASELTNETGKNGRRPRPNALPSQTFTHALNRLVDTTDAMRRSVLLVLGLLVASCAAKPVVLKLEPDLTLVDSHAVCNDGSTMQYYFKAATEDRLATTYLLYLSGGGWCWNSTSCLDRVATVPWETSSAHWPTTMKLGGIFDDDAYRSPLAGARLRLPRRSALSHSPSSQAPTWSTWAPAPPTHTWATLARQQRRETCSSEALGRSPPSSSPCRGTTGWEPWASRRRWCSPAAPAAGGA